MANVLVEGLLLPLVYLGATLGFTILYPSLILDSTLFTVYFLVTCTFYNAFLMLTIGFSGKRAVEEEDVAHYFSIIVPAKNEEEVIEETLGHILGLDYPEGLFEVVVVDDNSTDNTRNIVMRLQRQVVLPISKGIVNELVKKPFLNMPKW